MKNADKFVVGGLVYDVLSPATFGDYMETIGSACINPDGYAENKLFLAYDDNVQKLFRATTAIANSELLIKDTNCEPTTMAEALANALSAGGVSYDNTDSGLTASNVQDAIDEVNGDVETVNNDLTNVEDVISQNGAKNILPSNLTDVVAYGLTFHRNTETGKVSVTGTKSDGSTHLENLALGFTLPKGEYYISDGNVENNLGLRIVVASGGSLIVDTRTTHSTTFTLNADTVCNAMLIYDGAQNKVYNSVVAPIICLNSWPDKSYVPYAKTNRELTEESNYVLDFAPINNGYSQNNSGTLRLEKRNGVATFYWQGGSPLLPSANTDYTIGTLPNGFIPKYEATVYAIHMSSSFKGMYLKLKTDGSIHAYGYATGTNDILNCIPYGTYFV